MLIFHVVPTPIKVMFEKRRSTYSNDSTVCNINHFLLGNVDVVRVAIAILER